VRLEQWPWSTRRVTEKSPHSKSLHGTVVRSSTARQIPHQVSAYAHPTGGGGDGFYGPRPLKASDHIPKELPHRVSLSTGKSQAWRGICRAVLDLTTVPCRDLECGLFSVTRRVDHGHCSSRTSFNRWSCPMCLPMPILRLSD